MTSLFDGWVWQCNGYICSSCIMAGYGNVKSKAESGNVWKYDDWVCQWKSKAEGVNVQKYVGWVCTLSMLGKSEAECINVGEICAPLSSV